MLHCLHVSLFIPAVCKLHFSPFYNNLCLFISLLDFKRLLEHEIDLYYSCFRDARVMWDQKTGRSRCYGFVSFRNQLIMKLLFQSFFLLSSQFSS